MFKKKVRTNDKNYLLTYSVYNRAVSLVKPVANGSYSMTSTGPEDEIPPLASMTNHVTKEVIDALDTATIGDHNNLHPEHLKPDYFTVVFHSVSRVF